MVNQQQVVDNVMVITNWILPVSLLIVFFMLGVMIDRYLLRRLKHVSMDNNWAIPETITHALRRMPVLWLALTGLHFATLSITIKPDIVSTIRQISMVLILLSFTIITARLAVSAVNLYAKKAEGIFPGTSIFANLTELLIFIIGILIILQSLGISITPIITALGVGGLAVALALQETLSNLFAGLHILMSKQIRPSDYVKLEANQEGYIADITWRNTTIRTLENNMIVVPNAKLASAIVMNYSLPSKDIPIIIGAEVGYGSDLEHIEKIAIEVGTQVLAQMPGGLTSTLPVVRFQAFGESGIKFTVCLHVTEFAAQYQIKHEFIKRLYECFRDECIHIPYPTRTVYIKN